MKYSILIVGWFLSICLTIAPVAAAESKQIVLAADPWCPYNCLPESDLPGYLVELAQAVYQPHGYTVKYMNLPWSRALEYALSGTIDAAIGAVKGNIQGHYIGVQSLGRDETVLVVRKGERFDYTGPSAMDAKRLGVIIHYTYDNHGEIDQYLEKRKQEQEDSVSVLHQEAALTSLLNMLVLDRLDVVIENRFVAAYKAKELNISDHIEIISTGKGDDIYFAFTPNDKGRQLSTMLDEGVRQLRVSGRLSEILEKYGIRDWK